MRNFGIVLLGLLIVGSLLTYTLAYQVDELNDIVAIERFGKVTRVLSGSKDAGLHWKWPWPVEKVIRYDSRVQIFDGTFQQITTKDQQNLLVAMFCNWRIDQPIRFHTMLGGDTPKEKMRRAQDKLRVMLRSAKSDVVGKRDIAVFINTDPKKMMLKQIEQDIMGRFAPAALKDYGIKIERIGIRSLGLPQEVTGKVIAAMQEERQRAIVHFETQGESQAQAIEARARAARDRILAFADRKAQAIRTEGDQAAAKYYSKFKSDPQFSIFLRRLESLKVELSNKVYMVLDGSSVPAIRWFRDIPSLSPKATTSTNGSN